MDNGFLTCDGDDVGLPQLGHGLYEGRGRKGWYVRVGEGHDDGRSRGVDKHLAKDRRAAQHGVGRAST